MKIFHWDQQYFCFRKLHNFLCKTFKNIHRTKFFSANLANKARLSRLRKKLCWKRQEKPNHFWIEQFHWMIQSDFEIIVANLWRFFFIKDAARISCILWISNQMGNIKKKMYGRWGWWGSWGFSSWFAILLDFRVSSIPCSKPTRFN